MNTYDLDAIGKFLAERRKQSGYTQSQLADLLNTSFKTISSWENGRSFPDLTYQLDLCKYLKITLEELHTGKLNVKKRILTKIVNISLCVLLFIFILFIPAFIYLTNYYCKSYDSFKIYNLEGYNDKELVLRGNFIEYYKYNTLIISDITSYKDSNNISLQIYCNDNLIYQTNSIDFVNISIDNYYKITDNWIYKILDNNKIIKTGTIKYSKHDEVDIKKEDIDNIKDKQETIIKNLKKNGFKENNDDTYIKVINKNEKLIYHKREYRFCYYYQDNTMNKVNEYDLVSKRMNSSTYYNYLNKSMLVEDFVFEFSKDYFKCLSNQCPNAENIIKEMKKYITLLGLE